jgi:PAS domain-containing protein
MSAVLNREPLSDLDVLVELFQRSDDAIVVANTAGEIVLWNAAANRIYGSLPTVRIEDASRLVGMHTADGGRLLRVDELPLARALNGADVRGAEILLRRDNMPDRRIRTDAYPVRKDEKIIGAVVCSRQIHP